MKAYHIKRLYKLADHLDHGKRLHKTFSFAQIATGNPKTACNTAGCALGELPAAFPKLFKLLFDRRCQDYEVVSKACKKVPHFAREDGRASFKTAQSFFSINEYQACHLFAPLQQDTTCYHGELLDSDATPKQVASNIRIFCGLMLSRGEVAK